MAVRDGDDFASVGFEPVDLEHRQQIELIDALHRAVREGRETAQIDEILESLHEFSRAHFLSEELLMRLHAYPDYERHMRDHEIMSGIMKDLREAHRMGQSVFSLSVMSELRAHLVGHIRSCDRDLGNHLRTSGVKHV